MINKKEITKFNWTENKYQISNMKYLKKDY